jgi:hypothetical protein
MLPPSHITQCGGTIAPAAMGESPDLTLTLTPCRACDPAALGGIRTASLLIRSKIPVVQISP